MVTAGINKKEFSYGLNLFKDHWLNNTMYDNDSTKARSREINSYHCKFHITLCEVV